MAGPERFSVGLRRPSWRRWALLVILEAAELILAFLAPTLAGLAIVAFLMPFTACQILSDSSLGQRLFFRRRGGAPVARAVSPADRGQAGPVRSISGAARAISDSLRTLARRRGGPHLPIRGA